MLECARSRAQGAALLPTDCAALQELIFAGAARLLIRLFSASSGYSVSDTTDAWQSILCMC